MAKIKPRPDRSHGIKKSNASSNPDRPKEAGSGGNNRRSQSTIKRLNMYRGGKPKRNRKGQIVQAADYQSELPSGTRGRVEPNRRWFGNTRTITQKNLQKFEEEVKKVNNNPYQVILKSSKLPMSLLRTRQKTANSHILDTESFAYTFGKKARKKKPNLPYSNLDELMQHVDASNKAYEEKQEKLEEMQSGDEDDGTLEKMAPNYLGAGKSRRIWNELYKVLDCSDVVIQVLDARDPMGTRCHRVEKYLRTEKPHKHLIFILNKVDLIPNHVAKSWVAKLSSERPTIAFRASVNHSFGKNAVFNLLRQFGQLHKEKKSISCGLIGYPNVGKSSFINAMCKDGKVCKAAPIAGETKVWQYVTLLRNINLIDCPGIVQGSGDSETDLILKGAIRVENVKEPDEHIAEVLRRVTRQDMINTYLLVGKDAVKPSRHLVDAITWADHEDFLAQMALKTGKLLKGGEPDLKTCAKKILSDFQRGRIPYYCPPQWDDDQQQDDKEEGKPAAEACEEDEKVVEKEEESKQVEGEAVPGSSTTSTAQQDEHKPKTALELEKDLKIEVQDFDQIKPVFASHAAGEGAEDQDDDDEEEDETEEVEIERPGFDSVVGDGKMTMREKAAERKKATRKWRKRLRKLEESRFVDLNKSQMRRAEEEEKAKLAVEKEMLKRRAPHNKESAGDEDDLTSKQKRRKVRSAGNKKTGNNYYDRVNVKNRKRNSKNLAGNNNKK